MVQKSSSDLLAAPDLKILRASKHINDLDLAIKEYLRQKPIKLMTSLDHKTGSASHFLEFNIPIPWDIPMIIGDAIHALRAALDLTMFGMVGDITTNPQAVQFPFAKSSAALLDTIKNRQAHLAGKKVIEKIIAAQPYPGGNELLAACHTLDVADKHKLILPTASVATMTAAEFEEISLESGIDANISIHFGIGTIISVPGAAMHFSTSDRPATLKYERKRQPVLQIELADGQPLAAKPIIPALVYMLNEVRDTIRTLIAAYCS